MGSYLKRDQGLKYDKNQEETRIEEKNRKYLVKNEEGAE